MKRSWMNRMTSCCWLTFLLALMAGVAVVGCGALLCGCAPSTAVDDAATEARLTEMLRRKVVLTELRAATTDPAALALIDRELAKLAVPDPPAPAAVAPQGTVVPGVADLAPGAERVINAVIRQVADKDGAVTETIEHRYLIEFAKDGSSRVFAHLVEDVDPDLIRDLLDRATRTLYLPSGGK